MTSSLFLPLNLILFFVLDLRDARKERQTKSSTTSVGGREGKSITIED